MDAVYTVDGLSIRKVQTTIYTGGSDAGREL